MLRQGSRSSSSPKATAASSRHSSVSQSTMSAQETGFWSGELAARVARFGSRNICRQIHFYQHSLRLAVKETRVDDEMLSSTKVKAILACIATARERQEPGVAQMVAELGLSGADSTRVVHAMSAASIEDVRSWRRTVELSVEERMAALGALVRASGIDVQRGGLAALATLLGLGESRASWAWAELVALVTLAPTREGRGEGRREFGTGREGALDVLDSEHSEDGSDEDDDGGDYDDRVDGPSVVEGIAERGTMGRVEGETMAMGRVVEEESESEGRRRRDFGFLTPRRRVRPSHTPTPPAAPRKVRDGGSRHVTGGGRQKRRLADNYDDSDSGSPGPSAKRRAQAYYYYQ